jgi:hypothetical protein
VVRLLPRMKRDTYGDEGADEERRPQSARFLMSFAKTGT